MKLNFLQIFADFWAYVNREGLWLDMSEPVLKAKGVYRDLPFVIFADEKIERLIIVVDSKLVKITGRVVDTGPNAKLMNKPSGATLTKLALRL